MGRDEWSALGFILGLSLLVRLALLPFPGYKIDTGDFLYWFHYAAEKGVGQFYQPPNWSDYPPFNPYIFWLFGKLAGLLGEWSYLFFIKVPQNLADLGIALLIFLFLRPRVSPSRALGAAAAYAFNPGAIYNSAVWGQMDAVYTFFLVGSLLALLSGLPEVSALSFTLAFLTKPQSIVLLPVLALGFPGRAGPRRMTLSLLAAAALVFLVLLPFYPFFGEGHPLVGAFKFLWERYLHGYGVYKYNSINAYNFWSVLGFWKPDTSRFLGPTLQQWGILAFLLFTGYVILRLHRKFDLPTASWAAFLLAFGFFMLMTRMHERYLFPAFPFLALTLFLPGALWLYLGLTGTYFANLAIVLPTLNADSFIPDGHPSFYILTPLNILLFIFAVWSYERLLRRMT